jgi:hypothetical protein
MGRACSMHRRAEKCIQNIRTPKGMRPLGRPMHKWENNIKMDLTEIGCENDWIHLTQDRNQQ